MCTVAFRRGEVGKRGEIGGHGLARGGGGGGLGDTDNGAHDGTRHHHPPA